MVYHKETFIFFWCKDKMTKRITIHFKNPNIWDQFTEKIIQEHQTTRVYRTQILEQLLTSYINNNDINQQIQQNKETIQELQQENKQLEQENTYLKQQIQEQKENIHLLKNEIQTNKLLVDTYNLQEFTQTKEKNIQQTEIIKNQTRYIDDLKENIQELKETIQEQKKEHQQESIKQENKYNHLSVKHEKDLQQYNQLQEKIQNYNYLLGKYESAIINVKNMSYIDRLFNRIPTIIKELPTTQEQENKQK